MSGRMLTRKQKWIRVKQSRRTVHPPSTSTEEGPVPPGGDPAQALLLLNAHPQINKWDPVFWLGWRKPLRGESRSISWPRSRMCITGGGGDSRNIGSDRPVVRSMSMTSTAIATPEATGNVRGVRFDRCVRVLLVPSRIEFGKELAEQIWWGSSEITEFRAAAYRFWKVHGKLNIVTEEELAMPCAGHSDEGPFQIENS
ncbi:unnamed protein product, partial [Discosporangium mesarthrocarpum]